MNIVIVTGTITQIYDNGSERAKIIVADNYKDKATYIPISLFGNSASWAIANLKVGDHIRAQGNLGTYSTNAGTQSLTFVAHSVGWEGYKNPRKTDGNYQSVTPQGFQDYVRGNL